MNRTRSVETPRATWKPSTTLLVGAPVALVLAFAGWTIWSAVADFRARTATVEAAADPLTSLQHQVLHDNLGQVGDPVLGAEFAAINTAHFNGSLSAVPVRWEPRLGEAGKLADQAFTLEGLFGHEGGRSVILLNPHLQLDGAARTRALCHEMVHAYLFSTGDVSAEHGPAFQAVLRRLSSEGAFEGVPASDADRAALRAWLDTEHDRLTTISDDMNHVDADLTTERATLEHAAPADPDEAAKLRADTDAYNARAEAANDRIQSYSADVAHFNAEVARYNLMLVYPDGMDPHAAATPLVPRVH